MSKLEARWAVIRLAQAGMSNNDIMRTLKRGRCFVERWVAEARNAEPNVEDKPRSGRTKKVDSKLHKAMKRMATPRNTAVSISRRLKQQGRAEVSPSTVLRELKKGRVPLSWQPVVMAKRLRPANKSARQAFCSSTKMDAHAPWVFLDGKQMCLYSEKNGSLTNAWQRAGEPVYKGNGKLVALYFFYGAVAKGFKSRLYFVAPSCVDPKHPKAAETFKSEHFVGVMQSLAKDLGRAGISMGPYHIIRDKAKQHTSKATAEALAPLKLPIMESFPAQSWDINCIEHVWAQLAAVVRMRRPRSALGFKRVIEQEWAGISQPTIDDLVAGVPHRLKKIAELEGNWISGYQG